MGTTRADGAGSWVPPLQRGKLPPPSFAGGELGSLAAAVLHPGESQCGDREVRSLGTIQTGWELGGSPNFRGSGWSTQSGQRGWRVGWGNPLWHSAGKGTSPRHTHVNVGLQAWAPWPVPITLVPTWSVRSVPCLSPPSQGFVHLMPLEPPRKQRCLCVPSRGLPALPRDGWAAGRRLLLHADPGLPSPLEPRPRTISRRGLGGGWAELGPWGRGNQATWGRCAERGPEIRRGRHEGGPWAGMGDTRRSVASEAARPQKGKEPK